jgi:hypothetical protein
MPGMMRDWPEGPPIFFSDAKSLLNENPENGDFSMFNNKAV